MSSYEGITLLLSILAIAFSVYAWIRGRSHERRLAQIEESREKDRVEDRQRAKLVVTEGSEQRIDSTGKVQTDYFITLENRGNVAAEIEDIQLDGNPIEKHPFFEKRLTPKIDRLEPNSPIRIKLIVYLGVSFPERACIIYTDKLGTGQKFETPLSF